ncbi:hypothetical protein Tco_1123323 [Tanacetum coccineum]|uniref:Uncharacterized protein n=1 Tax=Tanacetum coccineum TaxID=301880 RepID=A0ABQ5J321_9ASTR
MAASYQKRMVIHSMCPVGNEKWQFQRGVGYPEQDFYRFVEKTKQWTLKCLIYPPVLKLKRDGNLKIADNGKDKGLNEEVPIVSTAEVDISTAGGTVTYVRRSAEKRSRQDKGKAIMFEEEPKKKSKKELEQERLSYAEAIRLEEQMNEEQRAQIARDEEIARQWDEEERKRAMDEAKTTKKIDWNDPSVIRYHSLKMKPKTIAQARRNMIKYLKNQGNFKISDFKGMSYNDIRPIFEKIWDFNQNIEPMDTEHGSGKQKSPQKSPEKSPEEMKSAEKMEEDDVTKETGAKRKKSIPRKSTRKRQKMEEDAEKEDLKGFLDIIPREEVPIEVESISTKFPIVDWKTCVLTETFMYYQVFRGDGSSKNYKILSEMLEDFDRLDVEELYRLVKERYSTSRPEGFDLMLWGDLHTLFEPDEDDEIWRDQHEYNLLSWRLCDFCGIHILLMENGLAIHMLTEKKIDQGVGSTSGIRACALRNFDLGKMELENSQNNALAKLPMLKLGEYEMWEIRIKQYFQIQDYALWEVIENGKILSYALSWKPCQGDSLNLPDHRAQVDQGSQIKMIQVKEMMQDNDLKNSKSKDKGSKSRSQSMDEQSHYKQDKTITRQSINVKRHIFNVIGGTEEFEERDLNIGGDC